jgi:Ice-binding-like
MKSSHRSLAASVELDPQAAEMKRSRLAAAGSLALRSKLPILSVAVIGITGLMLGGTAFATPTPVGLGTATDAAVLSGTMPTNTGVSTITGDASSSPNASLTQPGFGPCPIVAPNLGCVNFPVTVPAGGNHIVDGVANQQRADTTAALVNASSLGATLIPTQLGGTTQLPGVYKFGHDPTANIVGTLTLDAQGDANAVWIFQALSDLNTATGSSVTFINLPTGAGARAQAACNVFWTVGSSANLLGATFVGTILAQTSITLGDGVTVNGRLLAGTGNVTLIHDTIDRGSCTVLAAGTGGGPAGTGGGSGGTGGGSGGTGGGSGGTGGGAVATAFAGPATPVAALPKLTG